MPTFSNLNDLMNYAKKTTIESANETLEIIKGVLFDFAIKNVYEIYDPSEYTRTLEYLKSISVSKFRKVGENHFQGSIYFDSNKIHPYSRENQWNAHMSVEGIDITTSLPYWIEYGTSGSLWDRKPAHVVKDTENYLIRTNKLNIELRKALIKKGLKVKYIR